MVYKKIYGMEAAGIPGVYVQHINLTFFILPTKVKIKSYAII